MSNPLDSFSAPVREWFQEAFGEPTPPQAQGWPPIQRGDHTLILAPTGSGKTLASFLWGIDELYRTPPVPSLRKGEDPALHSAKRLGGVGVRLLYISPLKALNNDIERNLRVPLRGIREAAARLGQELPDLNVAVRTGDTPSSARAAMLKNPPQILITTPESLYLMLTSPRARNMFRTVRTVIVDEIHTLTGTKRGVHLSLSLERLEHLAEGRVQRIGLSATIKPLEEAARFLGGQEPVPLATHASTGVLNSQSPDHPITESPSYPTTQPPNHSISQSPNRPITYSPRPVTIVNAAYHKEMDLHVVTVVEDFRDLPGDTIWVPLIPRVLEDIRRHRSTLIFANNRRLAERTADRLNAQITAEESEEFEPGSLVLAPGGHAQDRGIFAIGAEGPIRAHHGSMSKEARRKMEEDLKAGKLPALVGTSSLELGIDIGSVDLVVHLQSPKSVAQGLQRIGRSGHLVGEMSVGHIYPTFREDLVEAAAIARGMLEGDVEPTYTPQNPLDVLAQQIVAMVAAEEWSFSDLYDCVRGAYAYRDLSLDAFRSVVEMLSGKYADIGQRDLRARIAWDRVNDRLAALPGSRLLAISNAGTIADTGAYGVYLEDRKTKVGELDEEFIYETRVGDAFLLGSKVWRVLDIDNDKVVVGDAAGSVPRMPFWHGDYPWRPYELGVRIGKFRREIADKLARHVERAEIERWLRETYALDENSVRNLIEHVERQLDAVGVMSSDKTIVVESFEDAVGEPRIVIHSPFGGRVNGAWALALTSAIREQTGVQPEAQTNDDGILFRFPQLRGAPPVDAIRQMSSADARERIIGELPNSALFGAHFRMNAARALLLPKARGQKRTPFWLQRLKAKDLLALVSRLKDFPIVAETYRDCLRDVLDLPHLAEVLDGIEQAKIQFVSIETAMPSPVAAALMFQFISIYMYEWDAPKAERQLQTLSLRRELLDDLLETRGVELSDLLQPEAIAQVTAELQHRAPGYRARSSEELALIMQQLGDLTTEEIVARSAGDGRDWLKQLAEQGRVVEVSVPTRAGPRLRWAPVELANEYEAPARDQVLARWLQNAGPVTRPAILERYTFDSAQVEEILTRLVMAREIVRGHFTHGSTSDEFVDRRTLEQIHRRTLTILRKQVQAVPLAAYADFLTRWQHVAPSEQLVGEQGLRLSLQQLSGVALAESVWERDVLGTRATDYASGDLEAFIASGEFVWVAQGTRVRLFPRGQGAIFLSRADEGGLSVNARAVYDVLRLEGASFNADLEAGLRLRGEQLRLALAELTGRGLITNDSWDSLRAVLDTSRRGGAQEPSPLEAEIRARLQSINRGPRPLTRGRYQDAKRRVVRRMANSTPKPQQGRWGIVRRPGILGPDLSEEERAEKLARLLLARYGIVTHECLEREDRAGDWSLLYPVWQRMEMRGDVRRGYFVAGLGGVQFALPSAVEKLRAPGDDSLVVLNATDPANIFGGDLEGIAFRFARVPSTHIILSRGDPVLVAEDNGERIVVSPGASTELVHRALEAYLVRPGALRHTTVAQWNGEPVLGSRAEELLQALDFHRTPAGMEK